MIAFASGYSVGEQFTEFFQKVDWKSACEDYGGLRGASASNNPNTDAPCPTPTEPANALAGNCTGQLSHDESCHFKCNDGFTLSGATTCHQGQVNIVTCDPMGCSEPEVPANAEADGCARELKHDESCSFKCNDGFALSGATKCRHGQVNKVTCDPVSDIVALALTGASLYDASYQNSSSAAATEVSRELTGPFWEPEEITQAHKISTHTTGLATPKARPVKVPTAPL